MYVQNIFYVIQTFPRPKLSLIWFFSSEAERLRTSLLICENVEAASWSWHCQVSSLSLCVARLLCGSRASCCCGASSGAPFLELYPKAGSAVVLSQPTTGRFRDPAQSVAPFLLPALAGSRHVCAPGQGSEKREQKMLRHFLFGCCNAGLPFVL